MVSELDAWRTANLLLTLLGDDAPAYAARRISELSGRSDDAGVDVWSRVMAALAVLRMREAPDDLPRQ
jgi:hypothetical protein